MLTNTILMLSLISIASKQGWLGITKLQKLCFLTEYLLSRNEKRAFDYKFFMYDLGPISTGVYDDFQYLMNEELIIEDEDGTRLSELGEGVLKQFEKVIPKDINSTMRHVVEKYAEMRTRELVDVVHKMRITLPDGIVMLIGNVPKATTILPKPLVNSFKIGKEYLETFRILCNRPLMENIREARRKGLKSRPYEPLVTSAS